jgi:hypothetical protein
MQNKKNKNMQKKLIDKTKLKKIHFVNTFGFFKIISKTKSQSSLSEALNRTNSHSDKLLFLA